MAGHRRYLALLAGLGLAALFLIGSAPRVAAGGMPCFLCHGGNFQGSDIAPKVAGTHLTDEQIISQVRKPRGVMPSFSQDEISDDMLKSFILPYIRSQAAVLPTMALPPQQRSIALATIAANAAARATAFAVAENATPRAVAAFPTPPPTFSSTSVPTLPASAPPVDAPPPLGIYAVGGALAAIVVGFAWRRRQRSK